MVGVIFFLDGVSRDHVGAAVERAQREGKTLVLPSGWVPVDAGVYETTSIMAAVGYPTGRQHSLIKAAEARLAVQFGAQSVLLALDDSHDENQLIADIVAVREAISAEVPLWVCRSVPVPAQVLELTGALQLEVPAS